MLTVGDKTPESDHGSSSWVDQDLDEFGVDFELTPGDLGANRKLQIFVTLAQTSAPGLKTGNFKCFLH